MGRRNLRVLGVFVVGCCALAGCNAAGIKREQLEARQVLNDLYEQQLVDNLARLDSLRPFVHLEYSTITGSATGVAKVSATPSGTYVANDILGSGTHIGRSGTLGVTGEGSQTTGLTFNASPVKGVKLYNAYVSFLNEIEAEGAATRPSTGPSAGGELDAHGFLEPKSIKVIVEGTPATQPAEPDPLEFRMPGKGEARANLKKSKRKPEPGTYCALAQLGDTYYFVPKSKADRFFKLYAVTTLVQKDVPNPQGINTLINQFEQFRINQLIR